MSSSAKGTTLEVLLERVDWIKRSIEELAENHDRLRDEIKEELVDVGTIETLRHNYITADRQQADAFITKLEEVKTELAKVSQSLDTLKREAITWPALSKYLKIALAVLTALGAILASLDKGMFSWFIKRIGGTP